MSQYASTIAAMESDLQALDVRRGQLIAAIGAVRALGGAAMPPTLPVEGRAATERPNVASASPRPSPRSPKPAAPPSTDDDQAVLAALRKAGEPMTPKALAAALKVNRLRIPKLVDPLAERGLVLITGVRRGRRIALAPVKAAPSTAAPAGRSTPPSVGTKTSRTESETELVSVWDGRKGSPSLTGDAAGLGSSLAGAHAVVGGRGR